MQQQQPSSDPPASGAQPGLEASRPARMQHLPPLVLALALGVIVLASGAGLDVLVQHQHPTIWSAIQPSDWFAATVAVTFFYRILLYERERRQAIRRRLEVIAEINHHIRNSLYVISLSTHSSQDQQMVKLIENSLQRIDWTLKQILPRL